ncbi:MAG: DUF5916 domain-containing protein, partial [Bacteroidota bacterium]|nr:DUF5916 domain-containing protein [Bacteroidota bacterium]
EEKRPFFLEGNDVFDFELGGDIPYYSRRIGSAPYFRNPFVDWTFSDVPDRTTILGAAKLSGKNKNGLSVGLIDGLTASTYGTAYNEEGTEKEIVVSPLSNYLVSRIKRDFKQGNTVVGGVFSLVNRFSSDSVSELLLPASAINGGLDLLHYWDNKNYFLEAKAIASQLNGSADAILQKQLSNTHRFQRPDADYLEVDSLREQLGGHGALIRVGKNGGNWNFYLQGQYRSPGLNLNDVGYIRQADFMGEETRVSYEMNEPKKWIRNYYIGLSQKAEWSFGGENTVNQVRASLKLRNNRLWSFSLNSKYELSSLNTRELRGGPALRNDPLFLLGVSVQSNSAKNLYGGISYDFSTVSIENSIENSFVLSLTWMPVKKFKISGFAHLWHWEYHQQYVSSIDGSTSTEYIVGAIDRNTASFTFRSELYVTPEMSIQFYGSPYYSVGSYNTFRRVNQSQARDINVRLENLDLDYDPSTNSYSYEHDAETYSFYNPDFSFTQLRTNLVFRWEYKLGSTLYFVWSHDRSGWESAYNPIGDIAGDLFGSGGNHVFMVKANFWFSL